MNISLVLVKKNGSTKNFSLPSSVTVVGRRQDCDMCIPLMVVSRRHCELDQDQGRLKIRDLGSRNGTFVNGRQIDEAELNSGDQIQIGPLTFSVETTEEPVKLTGHDSAVVQTTQQVRKQVDQEEETFNTDHVDTLEDQNIVDIINELGEEAEQ